MQIATLDAVGCFWDIIWIVASVPCKITPRPADFGDQTNWRFLSQNKRGVGEVFLENVQIPEDPWDWYMYLNLGEFYGKM